MEAHAVLSRRNFPIHLSSFGTGTAVKLPGPTIDQPWTFDFNTPYDHMYQTLMEADSEMYTRNGLLSMLDRNRKTKVSPERWHRTKEQFDIVITFDERSYDAIVEDMNTRGASGEPLHLFNLDTKDNHEEAVVGARQGAQLVQWLVEAEDEWEDEVDSIIAKFEQTYGKSLLHTVLLY